MRKHRLDTAKSKPSDSIKWRIPHRPGFTLVEMILVVLILSVVATAAVTASRSHESSTLEASAQMLLSDLRLVRSQAILHGTSYTVQFDVANNRYDIHYAGLGTAPPFPRPLAPPGSSDSSSGLSREDPNRLSRVELAKLGGRSTVVGAPRLGGAALRSSGTTVTTLTFGPEGGTGPSRVEDTLIRLVQGNGADLRYVEITVNWVTGMCRVQPISQLAGTP